MTGLIAAIIALAILALVEGALLYGAILDATEREDALHQAWWIRVKLCRKYDGWLKGANARRKRVERILKKERARHEGRRQGIFKIGAMLADALVENAQLKVENQRLENRNRVLAAEVTTQLLTAQDREGVVQGLTRKL